MKLLIALALVTFVAANDYSIHDDYNIDEMMENENILKNMLRCIRGAGKCTPEGLDFKKWTPEAVQNSCAKCSEKQKSLVARVMESAKDKLPAEWDEMNKMFNPDNKYDQPIKEFIAKYGSKKS